MKNNLFAVLLINAVLASTAAFAASAEGEDLNAKTKHVLNTQIKEAFPFITPLAPETSLRDADVREVIAKKDAVPIRTGEDERYRYALYGRFPKILRHELPNIEGDGCEGGWNAFSQFKSEPDTLDLHFSRKSRATSEFLDTHGGWKDLTDDEKKDAVIDLWLTRIDPDPVVEAIFPGASSAAEAQ